MIHAYEAVRDFDIVHDHTITGPIYAEGHCDGHAVTTNHGPFTEELDDIYSRAMAAGVSVIAISQHQASEATARVLRGVVVPSQPSATAEETSQR